MLTEQIKKNIQKGDYITLSKMLAITPENARMKIRRENEEALIAIKLIVKYREKLINKFKANKEKCIRIK
ncbi:hypothetical protein [Flavobacterium sp. U410]|jgi:hypothetical protein